MPIYNVNDLVTGVREKADMQNSAFVSDTEIIGYLNSGWQKLYGLLVERFENYYVSESTLNLVNGTKEYNLPSDFFKLLGVDLTASDYTYTLRPWSLNERNRIFEGIGAQPSRYILVGSKIRFVPVPSASYTAKLYYVPMPAFLVAGGTIDLPPYGEEYLTAKAGADCKQKEESDPSVIMAQEREAERYILEVMANRDAGLPQRMTDTSLMNDSSWLRWWPQ